MTLTIMKKIVHNWFMMHYSYQVEETEFVTNRIRQLRKANALTQDELHRRTGLSQRTISLVERGQEPAPRTVRILSEFFGVPGTYLMGLNVPAEVGREKEKVS